MALQLAFTPAQGVSCNYWRVDEYQYLKRTGKYKVILGLYKSSTEAGNDDKPMMQAKFNVDAPAESLLDDSGKTALKEIYAAIKLLDEPYDFTSASVV